MVNHEFMSAPKKLRSSRTSGVLLHPTSLPSAPGAGELGIGDLGPSAYFWIDVLARAKQTWWQILPLGPTGPNDSPYQSYSAFAGNPNLISPERLTHDGLLNPSDYQFAPFNPRRVDFLAVVPFKMGLLDRAYDNFRSRGSASLRDWFERFCRENAGWLDDFALFMALKSANGGASWQDWPEPLRLRDPAAVAEARRKLAYPIDRQCFRQFVFFKQWGELKSYAHRKGVKLLGDIPIFVNGDSADVWAHGKLFLLDVNGRQEVVAGVPPDYFSKTGQLWGNPLYDWNALKRTNYAWWVARLLMTLSLVDIVRIDHFRAFAAAWHVPADSKTAQRGDWVPGPGAEFFHALRKQLGSLPLIAEDLGLITPDVEQLRVSLGLPGMCVLQFAFGGDAENRYLPHNHDANCVVYTGTHDNDTTRGWYASAPEGERDHVRRYLGRDGSDMTWDLIRAAWSSPADLAITPLQDVLDLGSEARMNRPGIAEGNWTWRVPPGALRENTLDRLTDLTHLYGRQP
jgi:4-alpha-glucanotransferase